MATPSAGKTGNWVVRHKILSGIIGLVVLIVIISVAAGGKKSPSNTNNASATVLSTTVPPAPQATTVAPKPTAPPTTAAPTTTTIPPRQVTGKAVTLGTGNFKGGTDVVPGLYDVTPGPGESGNFIVQGGPNLYDEILGTGPAGGVLKVRVKITDGDSIQISSLSQVIFTPVTSPLVTTHSLVTLYAGTWTVGQDIGPGRYVATPGAGESGNFIVMDEGVDEILGSSPAGGVPNVTVSLRNGDTINISSLSQVTMTPA